MSRLTAPLEGCTDHNIHLKLCYILYDVTTNWLSDCDIQCYKTYAVENTNYCHKVVLAAFVFLNQTLQGQWQIESTVECIRLEVYISLSLTKQHISTHVVFVCLDMFLA